MKDLFIYQIIQQFLVLGGIGEFLFIIGSLVIYLSFFFLLFILVYGIVVLGGIFMFLIMVSFFIFFCEVINLVV